MFCYYSHGHNAYLKIIPYKVETVSLDPRVDLYHDVLSDYEIDVIKELATPRVNLMAYDLFGRFLLLYNPKEPTLQNNIFYLFFLSV